jgi:hypothetical protein
MDKKRVIGWLIPALYGFAVGILVAWIAQNVGPGRDAVFELFGIMALLIATYLKLRTGYNWPWEGQTEWAEPQAIPAKTYLRHFGLWVAIVVVLLVLLTLLQLRVN